MQNKELTLKKDIKGCPTIRTKLLFQYENVINNFKNHAVCIKLFTINLATQNSKNKAFEYISYIWVGVTNKK